MIRYLKEENYFEEIKKETRLLVDFYADWCGPCQRMGEILETLEDIPILKVNVDIHGDIASSYSIMSIPTLLLIQNGEVVKKVVGAISKEELINWLNE